MKTLSRLAIVAVGFLAISCGKQDSSSGSYVGPSEPFPHLGTSATFAVLGGASVKNADSSIVYGDIGVSPGVEMTGMSTIKMTGGEMHQDDANASRAQNDSGTAYNNLKNKTCDKDLSGSDLGGLTLTPGTYCFSSSASLSGVLVLDAQGDPNANFVFQINGSFTTAPNSYVHLINSGESCYVFWQVTQTASLGTETNFAGSIVAASDVTLNWGVKMNGKVISKNGNVSLDESEIYNNTCPWPGQPFAESLLY